MHLGVRLLYDEQVIEAGKIRIPMGISSSRHSENILVLTPDVAPEGDQAVIEEFLERTPDFLEFAPVGAPAPDPIPLPLKEGAGPVRVPIAGSPPCFNKKPKGSLSISCG